MKSLQALVACVLFLQGPVSFGEELKPLTDSSKTGWLIGSWTSESKLPADQRDSAPSGTAGSAVTTFRAFNDKIVIAETVRQAGAESQNYDCYVITQYGSGPLVMSWFRNDGAHVRGLVHADDEGTTLECKLNGRDLDAKVVFTGSFVIRKIDANTFTSQLKDMKFRGQALPDLPVITSKRRN